MKKRILFVLLFALTAGLIFAAGGTEKEAVAAAEGPTYGGRLTILNHVYNAEPTSPDLADGMYDHLYWLTPILEAPVVGDLEKYGPRGNGEYKFQSRGYIPWKYLKGHLVESWEVTEKKITWNVRPGVYWAGRGIMPDREMTADDVAKDLIYFWKAVGATRWRDMISNIYTTDKYTVVMDFAMFSPFIMYYVGYEDRALVSPPETEGVKTYEGQVGTGPFMFKEYAPGSYLSFERNPNYWKTTMIDGKEYKLPFADELRSMIIPDQATATAALRTAKVDFFQLTPYDQMESLRKTNPELLSAEYTFGGPVASMNCSEPPFDDLDVRRAMFVGTDFRAFHDLVGLPKDSKLHWYPYYILNPESYVPLEKLPAEDQLLYKYDPALAKKMLADAGYPNGFDTNFVAPAGKEDIADLLKFQWEKIGVDVKIDMVDNATHVNAIRSKTYKGTAYSSLDVVSPSNTIIDYGMKDKLNNYSVWWDPKFEGLATQVMSVASEDVRNGLMKEALFMLFEAATCIPLYPEPLGHFWWPWMQNYYGELTITDGAVEPVMAYVWIDQALKKKLGY
ncbi:MAG: ABC transporter substrate-binding protein [Spirochaetales bacterium]|nr:ABC transporter substrate-binding protein [Spirochaetales bacterium]